MVTAINLLDHELFADHEPWEVFDELQREAPVYFHPEPDGRGFWVVTKYDDVLGVVREPKTFSSEIGGAATISDLPEDVLEARRNFLEFDPPKHGRYRRLISTSFTPGAILKYEDWLRERVRPRLDAALQNESFDLAHEPAEPIPIRVLAELLGLPEERLPRLIELGDRLLVDTDPEIVGEFAYGGGSEGGTFQPLGPPPGAEGCSLGPGDLPPPPPWPPGHAPPR